MSLARPPAHVELPLPGLPTPIAEPLLEVDALAKRYGDATIFAQVDLRLARGAASARIEEVRADG